MNVEFKSEPLPADWAIEKALKPWKESNTANSWWTLDRIKSKAVEKSGWVLTILAFARLIEQHEEPPVDPVLKRAREISGQVMREAGVFTLAEKLFAGESDGTAILTATLKALKETPPSA